MAVRKRREYDIKRYNNTSKKLKNGFYNLKKREGKDKEITKYALSQHTGVAIRTIDNHEEILDMINKQKEFDVSFTPVDVEKITTIDEAMLIIEELNEINENKTEELKKLGRKNTNLNMKIVKLKKENRNIKEENRSLKEKLRQIR